MIFFLLIEKGIFGYDLLFISPGDPCFSFHVFHYIIIINLAIVLLRLIGYIVICYPTFRST